MKRCTDRQERRNKKSQLNQRRIMYVNITSKEGTSLKVSSEINIFCTVTCTAVEATMIKDVKDKKKIVSDI